MFDGLKNVDWELLHRQKRAVMTLLDSKRLLARETEALSGLVHLLDALQDDASAAGLWTFPGERRRKRGG